MIPQVYFDKIKTYFSGDEKKTWLWWKTPNPVFGISPLEMIKKGRENKVKQLIDVMINNKRLFA